MARGIIRKIGHALLDLGRRLRHDRYVRKSVSDFKTAMAHRTHRPMIFYLGVPRHSNIGDLAQYYCILKWIQENYPRHDCVQLAADTVVDGGSVCIETLREGYRRGDIIIFQSGYTTQDLGGVHDLMHRTVCERIPEASILMMPQTVFFRNEDNKRRSSEAYGKAVNMLFLARDRVSFQVAEEMFPDLRVALFPDIVTTLIGNYEFKGPRTGICMCMRNDGEKLYPDYELEVLRKNLSRVTEVVRTDTTLDVPVDRILADIQGYIEAFISEFSKYRIMITDRYHGIILSLAAGTPVIIMKTIDHKVVTGAEWFRDLYGSYIMVADDPVDAEGKALEMMEKNPEFPLRTVFREYYYDKLKSIFESDVEV